jgi:hypothetical protein
MTTYISCINKETLRNSQFAVDESVAVYIKQLEAAVKYPHLTKIQNVYPHLKPIEIGSEKWNREGHVNKYKCDFGGEI